MKRLLSLLTVLIGLSSSVFAVDVTVTMNTTSKTMSLVNKATDAAVEVGEPTSNKYSFAADAGTYVLTAYGSDGTTVNGTIELNITEEDKDFTVLTCTAYASNTGWKEGTDYTFAVDVNTREGVKQVITIGNSTTAGRKTFLALNGNSYYASFIPNAAHQAEGYMTLYKGGTLTAGVNVNGAIPMGADYIVTLPADAELYLGIKFAHFLKFQEIEPTKTKINGGNKEITYRLADSQCYNYRTWREGGLTQAGNFYMNTDATKRPQLAFTAADYATFGQKTIKHDVQWNGGYETGDIFVNINERGHLKMNIGDKYDAHAMRTWELTDNSTNNYFIEPDFHYTVINPDGTPSTGVIEIENPNTTTDPWSTIKAVGNGTAIVLVTYDAIGLNYYSSGKTDKTAYMGGEYWSAIWPENTAAYVVTVGDAANSINPNMLINETYNLDTKKNAGKYVDAEHDVFYYLDTEAGYTYTFKPNGVNDVQIAYPTIGAQSATYSGFASTGVTKNADGSYSVLLKEGRQIVKLTDASGNAVYQVLTAKTCHREIMNVTRPGSEIFQPGDKVKIQYSGLRHPANKLAGIYNMSGYVTYNGIPNGSSLILGSGQYTFGSAASAQAVTIDIPADHDAVAKPNIVMNDGVIQVNGYGDPIGNHRLISRTAGRSANFTAIAHKTYFGAIPDVTIPVTATRELIASLNVTPADAAIVVTDASGKVVAKQADGKYHVTYGTYKLEGKCDGYRALHSSFSLGDDAEDETTVPIALIAAAEGTWDGTTKTEPVQVEDVYQISNAAELAWVASTVNAGTNITLKAELTDNIDLGDFAWTPIGTNASNKQFKGQFNGNNHTIKGLYIDTTSNYQGFFGYTNGATVKDFTVEGTVTSTNLYSAGAVGYAAASTLSGITNKAVVCGRQYVSGITSYANGATTIDCCVNRGNITASSTYAAGITTYMNAATTVVTNCLNTADINGAGYVASIVANVTNSGGTVQKCVNIGRVLSEAGTTGNVYAAVSQTSTRTKMKDNYVLRNYANGADLEIVVTPAQLASGEVAILLGDAWGQTIGEDAYPVPGGAKVYKGINGYTNDEDVDATYELAILTFEDADFKGTAAEDLCTGTTWSSLIDSPQYGGTLLYGENGMGSDDPYYWWYDNNNTYLFNQLSEGWGSYCYWSGGHAVSNYGSNDIAGNGDYKTQLTVYNQNASGNTRTGNGHNGSNNFAVHYGYSDNSGYSLTEDALPTLMFYDCTPRVIDHMYVNNTTYALNCYVSGNSLTPSIGKDDWVKIVATGYDLDGNKKAKTAEIYLCNGPENIVTDWTKFDLSVLGEVWYVTFNVTGSSDNGSGFSQPAYFAYDDVAVRIPRTEPYVLADKSVYNSEVSTKVSDLTYTRTFGTTKWQPLYVPFTSDYEAWSEDVEIAEITSESEDGKTLTITVLEEGCTVNANTPYFIKAKKTGDIAIEVENATLVSAENASLTCGNLTFTGTYSPIVIQPDTYYVLHSGSIVKTSNAAGYNLPSMRWYAESANGGEIKIRVAGTDIETTIADIEDEDQTGAIYSTNGVRQQNLRKGINIVRMSDGTSKKIMVK